MLWQQSGLLHTAIKYRHQQSSQLRAEGHGGQRDDYGRHFEISDKDTVANAKCSAQQQSCKHRDWPGYARNFEGGTLLVGTTQSGKGVALATLITQAVRRGDVVTW